MILWLRAMVFFIIFMLQFTPIPGQAPSLPNEDQKEYYGLYWGAAGISLSLLEISQSGLLNADQKEKSINAAETGLNSIWENRYQENDTKFATWRKFSEGGIYPGQKYGAAGIIKVFKSAYEITGKDKYLEYAIEAIDELFRGAANSTTYPSWPYSYYKFRNPSGIAITDIKYGSLGIIDALLDVYQITGNDELLIKAQRTANWLYLISGNTTINGKSNKIIPWYDPLDAAGVYLTPYGQGNAGAIPILIRLASLSQISFWMDWAEFILEWLISIQQENGKWVYNVALPDMLGRTTRDLGVAGIVEALIFAKNNGFNKSHVDDSIRSGFEWLSLQLQQDTTHFQYPQIEGDRVGKLDMSDGLTGIIHSFRLSGIDQFRDQTISGYNWLLDYGTYNYSLEGVQLIGLLGDTMTGHYMDLSYSNGLAGVLLELLEVYESNFLVKRNEELLKTISAGIDTILFYQLDNGLWPRQVSISNENQPDFIKTKERKSGNNINYIFLGLISFSAIRLNKKKMLVCRK